MRIWKTNTILKRPVNKLFTDENTYHDTNQTDKAKEQKLKREVFWLVNINTETGKSLSTLQIIIS